MSMVTERKNKDLPISYCRSESELSSDSHSFEGYVDSTRSKNYSQQKKHSVIHDSSNSSLERTRTLEDIDNSNSEADFAQSKKRLRATSSSEESPETKSCSVSPEIVYDGSPVKYKLCKVEGTLLVIRKSMSSTPSRRSQKCTDIDISTLLDSDSDGEIFDSVTKNGHKVVGPLASDSKYSEKKLCTPSKSKKLDREDGSLRIKLRRSTEQSNYKIERNLEHEDIKCRTSQRSTKGTPKKCGMIDCDEDHSVKAIRGGSTLKSPNNVGRVTKNGTPRRTTRNSKSYVLENTEIKSLHNKENESELENDEDEDNDSGSSRGRVSKKVGSKQEIGTPAKQGKKFSNAVTPSSVRERRNSRLVNYNYDALESVEEFDEPRKKIGTPGRKILSATPRSARGRRDIESDDDADSTASRGVGGRKIPAGTGTPRKQIKKLEEPTTPISTRPRRNSKLVNYNYDGLEGTSIRIDRENAVDDNKVEGIAIDECTPLNRGITRKHPAREGSMTPRKLKKISEEPMTPKRTPRKAAALKLEEATPKKTPKKSTVKLLADEPPRTPTTPARRISKATTPSMKNGSLTPSMSRRTANVGKPKTILEEARAQLHVSAVPKSLPCREVEFNDIFEFLERKLLDNNGGCIYISGVPGTGKTATVNEAIRCLKKLVSKGKLENFDFIEINGMKLSEPRQAYVQILKQVSGQTATWEQAYQTLEKRFTQSTGKRPMTLLLVDELDLLCNKRQDVVYNLLDWPAKVNAQLVVITIANTMDLPERVLMGRVTSRLGLTRLTFQPYNHKQLQEIVMARLKDSDAFKSEAIQLVARKVAAVSGDARRALDICRRATEITELNGGKIVTMQDVNQALTEMIASAKVQAIKHCSHMEKIFLQAVCAEVARTGVEEASFQNVYRQLDALCSFEGLKVPNITQALGICARLGGNRLLLCEHSRHDTQQRILLNVSSDDIHFAMQTIDTS